MSEYTLDSLIFMYSNELWSATFREVVKWKQSKSPQETLLRDNCVRKRSNITSYRTEIYAEEKGSSDIVLFLYQVKRYCN